MDSEANDSSVFPSRRTLLTSAGVGIGAVLTVLPFITGGGTAAACEFPDGLYASVYDLIGIYPPGYEFQIVWSEMRVSWYDGCNGHSSSLWWSVIGIALLIIISTMLFRSESR
jgi:hypothetical protein